jgi:FkbM family methyltransferase
LSFTHRVAPDVRLRLHRDSELCRLIYLTDVELVERAFLNLDLRPGDIFVDVGANIGLFAIIAGRRVGPQGKVVAFEPSSKAFRRLQENVRLNALENVTCLRMALSDESGERPLAQPRIGLDAWNSLAATADAAEVEWVRTAAWDDLVRGQRLPRDVTMMKIDVEGWETHVLAGAKGLLSGPNAPVLQVEFTDSAAVAAGSSCRQLYATLRELGYSMYVFDAIRRLLTPDPLREHYPYVNLIAAKFPQVVNARLQCLAGSRR